MEPDIKDFHLKELKYVPEDPQRLIFSPRNQQWWYCSQVTEHNYLTGYPDAKKVYSFGKRAVGVYNGEILIGSENFGAISLKPTKLNGHGVNAICCNDNYLAVGSQDKKARVFDINTQEELIFFDHLAPVIAVDLHENFLATASSQWVNVFDTKHKTTVMSLVFDNQCNNVKFNQNLLTITSGGASLCIIDIQTKQKVASLILDCPILSIEWHDNHLQTLSKDGNDGKTRSFIHYDRYTLDQLKLKWALNFWLLLEKPDKSILKKKDLSVFMLSLLEDIITKCSLSDNETMAAWHTLPECLQVALYTTMRYKIRKHGKSIKKIIIPVAAEEPFKPIEKSRKRKPCIIQ